MESDRSVAPLLVSLAFAAFIQGLPTVAWSAAAATGPESSPTAPAPAGRIAHHSTSGARVFLPIASLRDPAALQPVPTVYPEPQPPETGYGGCEVVETSESWIDGVLYRVTRTSRYDKWSQPQQRREHYEHDDHEYAASYVYDRAHKRIRTTTVSRLGAVHRGSVETFAYNPDGRLTLMQTFIDGLLSAESEYRHDAEGNLVVEVSNRRPDGTGGLMRRNTYDEAGRRIEQSNVSHWTGEIDAVTTYRWDGLRLREADHAYVREGALQPPSRTRYLYDAKGRLERAETVYAGDWRTNWTHFQYDDGGRIERIQQGYDDSTVRETRYVYDGQGRLIEQRTVEGYSGAASLLVHRDYRCP